jgi:2,5-dichlorohydroquinone reductive dechlorinase
MSNKSTQELAKAARLSAIGDAARRTIVSPKNPKPDNPRPDNPRPNNPSDRDGPRLELFHFVMSVCSQKSRAALFEAGVEFASNELIIMPPVNENYNAAYVELRMASQQAQSTPLVGSYSGATDVAHEGFDPLVVPTLVDHESAQIVADSREIAFYANKLSKDRLIPQDLKQLVEQEVGIVDSLPHAGLFYGANPDGDTRPMPIQQGMKDAHIRKIEQVEKHMAALPEGSPLKNAYAHKIMKEQAGRAFISNPENMRGIILSAKAKVEALEDRLADKGTQWVAGDRFTLADIFWGVSLFRLLYLGYDWIWTDLPNVTDFAERAYKRKSIIDGAICWPGHPPGENIARFLS